MHVALLAWDSTLTSSAKRKNRQVFTYTSESALVIAIGGLNAAYLYGSDSAGLDFNYGLEMQKIRRDIS